jgi:hypothetical protein
MAGIPIISNFDVSTYAPIDSRIVVTNSTARTSLSYLYEGLKVYQTDTKVTWVYKGSLGWFVDGNGIYGGSGSLIGDTTVNTGSIGTTLGSQSYAFRLTTSTGGLNPYFSTTFKRNNNGSDYLGVEVTTAYSNDTAGTGIVPLSWVTYNAYDTISGPSTYGNIEYFVNTSKTLTIAKNVLRLWNPTYSATIQLASLTTNQTYNIPSQGGTFAMISDLASFVVGAPSLQSVTTTGATTSNQIVINNSSFLRANTSGGSIILSTPTLTGTWTQTMPNKTGTFAMLSDIPTTSLSDYTLNNLGTVLFNYTLVASDNHKLITSSYSGPSIVTITVPPYSTATFATGSSVDIIQLGTAPVTFTPGSGVTLNSQSGYRTIAQQYVTVTLINLGINNWILVGNLIP